MPFPTEKQLVLTTLETILSALELIKKDPRDLKKSVMEALAISEDMKSQADAAQKSIDAAPAIKAEADAVLVEAEKIKDQARAIMSSALENKAKIEQKLSVDRQEVDGLRFSADQLKKDLEKKLQEFAIREKRLSENERSAADNHAKVSDLKTRYEKKINLLEQSKAV